MSDEAFYGSEKERDAAFALLGRIYRYEADHQLNEDGMVVEWIEKEIAAFIREFGPLPTPPS